MTDPTTFRPPTRRLVLGAFSFVAFPAFAAVPPGGRLRFAVFRNGARVGEHTMSFSGRGPERVVVTEAAMTIKLGPVPVFRYRHQATERWRDERFDQLQTTTDSNGKAERVSARRTGDGVVIETAGGRTLAPAASAPLTHWNPDVLGGPLFNPQTGKRVNVAVTRRGAEAVKTAAGADLQATRWSLRGDAEIDNWYDAAGVWAALRGRLPDKSLMEYRRV